MAPNLVDLLTPIAGDFYCITSLLNDEEREILANVRTFMETQVAPIINDYWERGAFPFELIPALRDLQIAGLAYQGYGCPGHSQLLNGLVLMEMARIDSSIAIFHALQSELVMGTIYLCGSEAQKHEWLPRLRRYEITSAFCLTEPAVGSGAARGLQTTARREGDTWVISGEKKWPGNATFADILVIWAKDEADGQVKGFLMEKGLPGLSTSLIPGKMALRVVQNASIHMDGVRVPESHRLQQAHSFRDTAAVLRMTRASVAWQATGCGQGAYEHALKYAKERQQFGKPIGSFQLIQDLLFKMLSNVTASQSLVLRLAAMQQAGEASDEHSALAKAFCASRARETVGYARELLGGNGIVLEYNVWRFFADAEATYSYEGTREMNALIVGRAATGYSAFV